MRLLSQLIALFVIAAPLALSPARAQSAADAGMINQLSGEVSYQSGGVAAARATAYMKLRDGDVVRVAANASVRVVYFATGRQEAWKGPASFTIGANESRTAQGNTAQPQVSQLPGGVPAKLAQTPEMMAIAKLGRAGSVTVRGIAQPALNPAQTAEVQEARRIYERMKGATSADDIMPEIYLYTVVQQYSMYDEMKQLVRTMQSKQPNNDSVRDLDAWVENRKPQ